MGTNNAIYDTYGYAWWDEDIPLFSTIRFFINPVRFGYFKGIMDGALATDYGHARLLDVGCGGGFLAEEFAKTGLAVTGIDPSPATIDEAKRHARVSGLDIDYRTGFGEDLPFEDGSFDLASCCDTLEHVGSPERVIAEIARVLKPGGAFFYDTINRTPASWIISIKVMQEWKNTAFVCPGTHVWKKFIRPAELLLMTGKHGLMNREMLGLSPGLNPVSCFFNMRRAASGRITYRELGARLRFRAGGNLLNSYIGFAVKAGPHTA